MSYPDDPGHAKGSKTSKAAAESMKEKAPTLRAKVLDFIKKQRWRGATDDEIEVALDMRHQTASARRRELVLAGLVRATDMKRKTRSGRSATVWAVPKECSTCWFWTRKKNEAQRWCTTRGEWTEEYEWCKCWEVRRS